MVMHYMKNFLYLTLERPLTMIPQICLELVPPSFLEVLVFLDCESLYSNPKNEQNMKRCQVFRRAVKSNDEYE